MVTRALQFDDLDGSPEASTLRFSVAELQYEVDLCEVNRKEFDEFLARYIAVARAVGRHPQLGKVSRSNRVTPESTVVRELGR